MTDDDIGDVEKSMKKINSSFEFRPGDKKLIKSVALYVKDIVDGNGKYKGVSHFKIESSVSNEPQSQLRAIENSDECKTRTHFFLKKLLTIADKNAGRNKHGYRHDDPDLKMFASYMRMIMGTFAYETIQRNMECAIPSLVSVNRYINASGCHINEGILRTEELRLYLSERSLQPIVVISEDATRISGRIQYDRTTNQLIGFVLPLNSANGLPIPFAYPARNAEEIINHFTDNTVATYMNVIMAQPLANAPAFCLMIFGSDNKYTSMNVVQRWKYIQTELAEVGITALVYSSDSDPRYNKAMRELSGLGKQSEAIWFSSQTEFQPPFYLQDIIHIATKLRNFFLSTLYASRIVPFGKYFVKLGHLHDIMERFSKDRHLLTPSVLDRQNFKSVLRICDERVTTLLRDDIDSSDGTRMYLQIIRDIISCFMDLNLTPIQRIRKIWYSVFLIRIWRESVVVNKNYTLKDNFISANCYACIELNAHELVRCLLYLKEIDKPEYFVPFLFNSQPCESIFRQFRSFTTTYSTVINCSLKESISRVSKIHLQNQITQGTSSVFVYPRAKKSTNGPIQHELPTKKEIFDEIEQCQKIANLTAIKFGLVAKSKEKLSVYPCQIKPIGLNDGATKKQTKSKPQNTSNELTVPTYKFKLSDLKNIQLKNYAEDIPVDAIGTISSYVEITCDDGKRVVVKKTSLCWLMGTEYRKMSSDRLLRVKYSFRNSKSKPKYTQKVNKRFIRSVQKFCSKKNTKNCDAD